MRGWRLLNLALVAALLAFSIWAYPQLPDRIPTHFGTGGDPDAWSDRTVAAWFLLPGVSVFVTLLLLFVGELVGRRPQYVNMPAKARLLELPPEEQRPILRRVQLFVYQVNALMLVILSAIQLGSWRAAQNLSARGIFVAVMLGSLVGLPLLTISLLITTTSAIKEAHRRATLRGTIRTLAILLAVVLAACTPGTRVRPAVPPAATLEQSLRALMTGFQGDVGIYVRHLESGQMVAIAADDTFPTASMIKLALLCTLYERAAQ